MADELGNIKMLTVKAAGDWELDVLGNPYGPDSDNQWFDDASKIIGSNEIPAIYYHGIRDDQCGLVDEPVVIGKAVRGERNAEGQWWRVVLDKSKAEAVKVWEAAKKGLAVASSGAIDYLSRLEKAGKLIPYRKDVPGRIAIWHMGELSLWDWQPGKNQAHPYAVAVPALKSVYEAAGLPLDLQTNDQEGAEANADSPNGRQAASIKGDFEMEKTVEQIVAEALQKQAEAQAAAEAAKKAEQERIDAAVKAAVETERAEAAKSRRLPTGQAPYVAKFGDLWKYDNTESGDLALGVEILNSAHGAHPQKVPTASKAMLQALAIRAMEGKQEEEVVMNMALKAAGMNATKSDEVMQQDLTSYGDEWVGVGYGTRLWEKIRTDPNPVLNPLPMTEIPQGYETFYDPTEGADPVWYKVPETTDENATTKIPNATVTSSKIGTGRANETLAKAGARTQWSGEMNEDSLIPMLPEMRRKLVVSGQEQLAAIVINGDTETGASTNVNDIAGTPAGTETFMMVNGFRKVPLVTNTANSRAAGALDVSDFIETVKLMGLGGKDALDRSKVSFIIDLWTHWKALQLSEVLTKDAFSQPTLEGGKLTGLWGYPVIASEFMHFANQDATYGLKANSAGKLDLDTAANNLYGAILAVRWDRWKFGWKRRMTIETERIARYDAYEIVALVRFGLKYFSTEASAISYGVQV
jgi:hypothetical protein